MANWKEKIAFKGDRTLWYVLVMLMIISVMVVYSSTGRLAYNKQEGNTMFYLGRQLGLLAGCFGVLFVMQTFSWRWFYRNAGILLVIAAGLLLLAAFGGTNINGAGRWIKIPVVGITFQPSEFAKIAIVIYTAKLLSDFQTDRCCEDEALKRFWMPAGVIALIFLDNFSTSALTCMVCMVMFMLGRIRWKLLAQSFGTLVILFGLVVTLGILVPQVQEWGRIGTIVGRLSAFFVSNSDPDNEEARDYNFQSDQACIAVAQGGLMGCGPGNSVQRNFLPHAYSDFIYAIIIEEYGLGGGAFILLLYAVVLFRAGVIGRKCMKTDHLNPRGAPDIFPTLVVVGLGLSVVLQALFHMGVNVGALPVTGQTLPLVSMGGTSLWFTSAAFGIMLGIAHSFSPEGQAEEAERLKIKSAKGSRKRKEETFEPEEYEEEMVDSLEDGELPEMKPEIVSEQAGRRRGRRPADDVIPEEDIDVIEDMGIPDIEEELESEGRKVLKELQRRGRRGGELRDQGFFEREGK